ncbi:MAG: N-6 DNA methylase, partial [Leptospiraceae bacterium]|nr:N-6 DNA methylase [Leptospiraceae bacterium]
PTKDDKASVGRIFYCTYLEYEKHFEFIYNTFSKTAILKGSFDRYIEENKNKKGTSEVDRELLKLIEDWRTELAKNLALRNLQLDIYNLNLAVQKIIDRIIFLRIAEDKEIESYGRLLGLLQSSENIYFALDELFRKAYDKYNSDLFLPVEWISNLKIDGKILTNMIQGLYYPECPYEFSILPVEILGNIYEQFLGKTIQFRNVKGGHTAVIEEKLEVRKAGGVYYTPSYIVQYIVENTVGEKIQNQTPDAISKLKICDPACGSGSFLVGAYEYLLNYHLNYYTQAPNVKKALKDGKIFQVSENTYKLTIEEKQRILVNNIFGVDIDPQAVEVTKLSLYLKLLENEGKEWEGFLFKHSDFKLLPNLDKNIQCGNSLIKEDFYYHKDMSLFGMEEMRKINAFDWEKKFSSIFQEGGFDVVIGNPPYEADLSELERKYLENRFQLGNTDTACLF